MNYGWGGAREGAGRPAGPVDPDRKAARTDLEEQKARHERIKADKAELDLEIMRGRYVEREAVIAASATAHAVLAQSLRSLSDSLERKYGLPAPVLDGIRADVDAALNNVAIAYKALTRDDQPGLQSSPE